MKEIHKNQGFFIEDHKMWERIPLFSWSGRGLAGLVLLRGVDYTENRLFFVENSTLENVSVFLFLKTDGRIWIPIWYFLCCIHWGTANMYGLLRLKI